MHRNRDHHRPPARSLSRTTVLPSPTEVIHLVAIVSNGLLAGIYLAFSVAISPALVTLDARTHVHASVAINRAILNPVFLSLFIGAPISTCAAAILSAGSTGWGLIVSIGASACALLALGITVTANVPQNRALERTPTTDQAQVIAASNRFAHHWGRANDVRAAACILATLTLGWTMVVS